MLEPGQFIAPDRIVGHVDAGRQVRKEQAQGVEVEVRHLLGAHQFGALGDLGLDIHILGGVDVILAVLLVVGDKLAAHRAYDLAQRRLHLVEQHAGVAVLRRQLRPQAQAVAQFLRRHAHAVLHGWRRQPLHAQPIDDAQRHLLERRPRVAALHPAVHDRPLLHHRDHAPLRAQAGVVDDHPPVVVIGDQPRLVRRHGLVEHAADGRGQRLEHLALLGDVDLLEGLDIGGVDGIEARVLAQPVGQARVERCKAAQVGGDPGDLLVALGQQPLLDDIGDVLAGDAHLVKAGAHPLHRLGKEGEGGAVEERLLDARHKAEGGQFGHFAQLAQKAKVQVQPGGVLRPQIVEQFVDHQQQAVIGVFLVEEVHGLDQAALVLAHLVQPREGVFDPFVGQKGAQLVGDDVIEAARHRAQLHAQHLVLAGKAPGFGAHACVLHLVQQLGVLGQRRDHRHQVRLARAIVADDKEALVVHPSFHLELGEDQPCQLIHHAVGEGVGLHQPAGLAHLGGFAQLDDGVKRFKLDKFAIEHGKSSLHLNKPRVGAQGRREGRS